MRYDVLTGEWIPMASNRMDRTFLPAADSCPLCPADPASAYSDGEIPSTDYDVVVFENRFPSYWRAPGQDVHAAWTLDGEALWPVRQAAGRCEVICFSPDHTGEVAGLSEPRMRTIIEAWAHRTAALQAMDGIAQVYPFENRGPEIGVTLPHPHGQIYAYPNLTPRTAAMVRQAEAHQAKTGRKLLSDVVEAETRGPRLIAQTERWVAYVPAAARWPVELHLAPVRDVPDLPALDEAERAELARLYPRLLRACDRFFAAAVDAPAAAPKDGQLTPVDDAAHPPLPYISGWHQAPVDPDLRRFGRLHLQLFSIRRAPGKLKYLAGSESGMGAWISDTTPERIADRLRAALTEADAIAAWGSASRDGEAPAGGGARSAAAGVGSADGIVPGLGGAAVEGGGKGATDAATPADGIVPGPHLPDARAGRPESGAL
jgi:UDPglucose--hexose-1-phosphate uridylyltransferase